jgi:A/G-specific adenine glycosylase
MDLGASLRAGTNANRRSRHYSRQSEFAGSVRQARGAILRLLAESPGMSRFELETSLPDMRDRLDSALSALSAEGFLVAEQGIYRIP